jgi:hypothetical protein
MKMKNTTRHTMKNASLKITSTIREHSVHGMANDLDFLFGDVALAYRAFEINDPSRTVGTSSE